VGSRNRACGNQRDLCRAAANPVTDGLDRLIELLIGGGRILLGLSSGGARP
jgi:hypothetical protein